MSRPPVFRTYSRKNIYNSRSLNSQVNVPVSASSAFDALIAKNVERRNSYLNGINMDSPCTTEISQSTSTSLHVKVNSTFDHLLNGTNYNIVNFRNVSSLRVNSSTEHSSVIQNHVSPCNTRKKTRRKSAVPKRKETSKRKCTLSRRIKQNKSISNKKQKTTKKITKRAKISKEIPISKLENIQAEPEIIHISSSASTMELNSYDKSISYNLVIEKEVKRRRTNSLELSRALQAANKKWFAEHGNSPNLCARKFTPIASTSRVLTTNLVRTINEDNSIFQHGFQHRMYAESTPKYITSSTPINTRNRSKLDVSPIRIENRTKLSFDSPKLKSRNTISARGSTRTSKSDSFANYSSLECKTNTDIPCTEIQCSSKPVRYVTIRRKIPKGQTESIPKRKNCRSSSSKALKASNCIPRVILQDRSIPNVEKRCSLFLKPGKHWFRSLSVLRNSVINKEKLSELCNHKGRKWRESVCALYDQQDKNLSTLFNCSNVSGNYNFEINQLQSSRYQPSVIIIEESENNYSKSEHSSYISTVANESILESFDKLSLSADVGHRKEAARQIILKRCDQTGPITFEQCFSTRTLEKCRKIGEGVYGEVFMYKSVENQCKVLKIIPIEGSQEVNGERQKKFEEIFSEIIVASELSNLRTNKEFCTDGFATLMKVHCVQGKYPKELIELWDLYDEEQGSENDSPDIFTDDQLYIILELSNGGKDLESYQFNNAEQTYALFVQMICTLAVAESALKFEHRDLHWGNVLISTTDEPISVVRLNGRELEISNKGVKLSIIDFTLSRITHNNCCIYNDLALDPDLFTAIGDYQFDIYRLMQKRNENNWQKYEPYSNILWLDYTLEKLVKQARYRLINSRTHKSFLRRLTHLRKNILSYSSATDLINSDIFSHMFL